MLTGNLIARLGSKHYPTIRDLARDIASILSAEQGRATVRRGLAGGVIAGLHGGTTLDVGDPAAARTSSSLQMPQRGLPVQRGPIATRSQGRAEIERRTLPGVVVSSTNGASSIELRVYVPLGATPKLATDPSTGQNTAVTDVFGTLNSVAELARTGGLSASQLAQAVTVTVPRPAAVSGHQPTFTNGQIIDVTSATQFETRTVWTQLDGKRVPVQTKRQVDSSYSVNSPAQCCEESGGGGGS